jgi:signal transduction histidine kinase
MNRAIPELNVRQLRWAFLGIIALFAALNLVFIRHAHVQNQASENVSTEMVSGMKLVSHLTRDLDDERLLIDAHIFEKGAEEEAALEREIARARADFDRTASLYELVVAPGPARETWESIRSNLHDVRVVADRAIELSRGNDDVAARQVMTTTEPRFQLVHAKAEQLLATSDHDADEALRRIVERQHALVGWIAVLTSVGVAIALLAAFQVPRLVQRQELELRRLALRLEEQNRELDAFAGRVAHDLRGPLTAVSLASHQIVAIDGTRAADVLQRNVARMESLISDLLALARLDQPLGDRTCQTALVADAVRTNVEPRVVGAKGRLRVDVAPATVHCTPTLLQQAITNLADNATKYRRPDVPLDLRIEGRIDGDAYVFSVSDNGRGLEQADASKVFEPLYRADTTRDGPGTGLGLAIVRRVAEAFGGAATVESKLGAGSKFSIRLPLVRDRPDPALEDRASADPARRPSPGS